MATSAKDNQKKYVENKSVCESKEEKCLQSYTSVIYQRFCKLIIKNAQAFIDVQQIILTNRPALPLQVAFTHDIFSIIMLDLTIEAVLVQISQWCNGAPISPIHLVSCQMRWMELQVQGAAL